ncbi:MAG: hypothetical protein M3464_12230 [Chloroflexota bacterium]|nr:hypothetical protein [Chloroflexota bacterium]
MLADIGPGLSRRTALKGLGAAGVVSLVSFARPHPAQAQSDSPEAADLDAYPELEIIGDDYSFAMPTEFEGGLTRVTLVNDGDEDHHAIFIRLGDSVTAEDVDAAAANPDFGPMIGLGDILGGPNGAAPGGGRSTAILDLAPGDYVVVCVIPDADGIPHYVHGMIAPLTVTESASALEAPDSALTVELVDFDFDHLPAEIPSRQQVWEVINVGQEPHELIVFQIAPGVPFAVIEGIFGGAPAPASTPGHDESESHEMDEASPAAGMAASPAAMGPPFVTVAGIAPMNPGFTNWLVLDLAPGEYFAICFVPSPAMGGAPHFALGMLMPFTVV